MTKRKTTLIQKDPPHRTAPNNYRSITCLLMTWNIPTTQIREQINYSLISRGIFPDEHKRRCKRTRSTEELLYINQHILNESKTGRKNLAMAWNDYKKVYDMIPQRWILHCFKVYKIPDQIIQFIENTMQTWRVELTAGGQRLAEKKIQRGIIHGDAQSQFLLVIAMMTLKQNRGCPRGVMVKAMDCEIEVSEFELQSCYCVHFRANSSYGINSTSTVLQGE